MKEDEIMFHWGIGLAVMMVVVSAILQVCYRHQDRARARVKAEIVRVQQETAENQTKFSTLTRPEVLRSVVMEMYPRFEPLGFKKTIDVNDIKLNTEATE